MVFYFVMIDFYWWLLMFILSCYVSVVCLSDVLGQKICWERLENLCCYYKNYEMSGINSVKNYKYSILVKKYGALKI